jgi:diaminobutyrate-2-oxoglutarate transaminase
VLKPRHLPHRVQFCGPTGSNAVEAALKIARRATGRMNVVAFTNGFHGMSLGALAATANLAKRAGAGAPLAGVTRLPYDDYLPGLDSLAFARRLLTDPGGGVEPPAAIILECVQGEGGARAARPEWVKGVAALAQEIGALLIVDDIQAGCGRTGGFFSFDEIGVVPDLVCLSKSLGGLGFPLAVVLVRPEFDTQPPGAHSGTFRGNNLAFVAGAAALDLWRDPSFTAGVAARAKQLDRRMTRIAAASGAELRGRGLLRGLAWSDPAVAGRVSARAFDLGVLAEPAGPRGETLKLLPPLTIPEDALDDALDTLQLAISEITG